MQKPIGYISYTHGLDGKVKVVPMVASDEFESFVKNSDVFLSSGEKILPSIFAFNGKVFICKIEGYDTIDKAKLLLKKEIFVEVEENNNYIDAEKLIGFVVLTKTGEQYGKVVDCGDYGGGMLIEIELYNKNSKQKTKKSEFYSCNKDNILSIDYDKMIIKINNYDR